MKWVDFLYRNTAFENYLLNFMKGYAFKERLEAHRFIPLDDGDDLSKHSFSNKSPEHTPKQAGMEEQK